MAIYGRQVLGTLHERVGEQEQLRGNPALGGSETFNGVWGRMVLRHGESEGDPLGIYGSSNQGPSYQSDLIAFQIGTDIYRSEEKREDGTTGARDHAGLIATFGMIDGEVDHNLLDERFEAGKIDMDIWSAGGFWTHYEPNGAYIDLVAHLSWYDIEYKSRRLAPITTDGFGLALSAEGGYPLRLSKDWQLEPQAQLIYQALSVDSFDDPGATVRFRDLDSLVGRVGFRFSNIDDEPENGDYEGWLQGNIWHEFLGEPKTQFSSEDGFVSFQARPPVTWWQVGGGLSFRFTPKVTFYAAVNYDETFNGNTHGIDGKVGLRINW
jgi:outer membrane autotransporter protein